MVDHLISRRWVSIIVCKQGSRGIHEQKLHRTFCVYVKLCHSATGGCRDTRLRSLGASGAPSREQREHGTQRSRGSVHTACTYGVWQAGMNPALPSTPSIHSTYDADAAAATSRRGHGCGCGRGYSMQQHKRAAHVWMTIWVFKVGKTIVTCHIHEGSRELICHTLAGVSVSAAYRERGTDCRKW